MVESEGARAPRLATARLATPHDWVASADTASRAQYPPSRSPAQLRSLRLQEVGSVLTQRWLYAHPALEELRVLNARSMSYEDVQVGLARVGAGECAEGSRIWSLERARQ